MYKEGLRDGRNTGRREKRAGERRGRCVELGSGGWNLRSPAERRQPGSITEGQFGWLQRTRERERESSRWRRGDKAACVSGRLTEKGEAQKGSAKAHGEREAMSGAL